MGQAASRPEKGAQETEGSIISEASSPGGRRSVIGVSRMQSIDDEEYEEALRAYLKKHTDAQGRVQPAAKDDDFNYLFFWALPGVPGLTSAAASSDAADAVPSEYWATHKPYLIRRGSVNANGASVAPGLSQAPTELEEVQRVRAYLEGLHGRDPPPPASGSNGGAPGLPDASMSSRGGPAPPTAPTAPTAGGYLPSLSSPGLLSFLVPATPPRKDRDPPVGAGAAPGTGTPAVPAVPVAAPGPSTPIATARPLGTAAAAAAAAPGPGPGPLPLPMPMLHVPSAAPAQTTMCQDCPGLRAQCQQHETTMKQNLEHMTAAKNAYEARLSALETQLTLTQIQAKDRDTLQSENAALRQRLLDMDADLKAAANHDVSLTLEARCHHLEDELEHCRYDLDNANKQLEWVRASKMDSDKIINEQNAHAALQSAEIDELKRVLNLARLSAASATPLSAPGDLMQQLAELQQAKAAVDARLVDAERSLSFSTSAHALHLSSCTAAAAAADQKVAALEASLRRSDNDLAEHLATCGAAKVDQQAQLALAQTQVAELRRQLDAAAAGAAGAAGAGAAAQAQAQALAEQAEKAKQEAAAAAAALADARATVAALEGQVAAARAAQHAAEAAAAALRVQLADQLAAQAASADAVAALKKKQIDDLTAGNAEKERTIAALQSQLAAATAAAGGAATASAAAEALRKQVLDAQALAAMHKGTADTAAAALEAQRAQGKRDQDEIARQRALLDEAEAQIRRDIDAISALQAKLAAATAAPPPPPPAAPAAPPAPPAPPSPDLAVLQLRLNQAEAELAAARARAAAAEAASADLKRQAADTAAKLALLENQAQADQALIEDLKRQLAACEKQAKADKQTVADLRKQLEALLLLQRNDATADAKRVADLREVNDTLLAFARERAFQEDLKRPLVRVALDCWDGKAELHPEEVRERSRFDDGVSRIYPRMKAFELVCNAAKIKFPIDHIVAGKTELSKEAVTYNFGPDFVAKHHQTAK